MSSLTVGDVTRAAPMIRVARSVALTVGGPARAAQEGEAGTLIAIPDFGDAMRNAPVTR